LPWYSGCSYPYSCPYWKVYNKESN